MRGSQCRSRDVNFQESVALRQRVYYKIIWNLTTELVMWKNPDEGLTFEKSALEFLYDVHWLQSLTRLTSALEFLYDVHWIQSLTRLIQRNVIVSRLISAGARRSELFTRKQGNNHKPHRIPLLKLKTQKIKGFCIKFLERNEIEKSLNCFLCSEWKWWPARLRKYMCNLLSSPDTNKATRRKSLTRVCIKHEWQS